MKYHVSIGLDVEADEPIDAARTFAAKLNTGRPLDAHVTPATIDGRTVFVRVTMTGGACVTVAKIA